MHNWNKATLKQDNTMEMAIKILNQESLRIVMVVDQDERLVGTITDGDIRRGLIKQLSLNAELSEFMFRNPTVASLKDSKSSILAIMKKLDLLQIIVKQDRECIVPTLRR